MKTVRRMATLGLLALTLLGCSDPEPKPVKVVPTSQVVTLTIGMKGRDAIAAAGIPCPPATIQAIERGENVTVNYQGHSYVFSKGVLEAVR